MKFKTLKVFSILAACALAAGSVQAQDKALLNTLVQKGYLTQAEADQVAASSVSISASSRNVKSLRFTGRVHTQFNWVTGDDKQQNAVDPAATTSFQMRRVYLGAIADLGNGWRGTVVANFVSAGNSYLDQAHISKNVDWDLLQGRMTAGFRKVQFGYEENTSSARIVTVERSIATRYWAEGFQANGRVGVGSRHVGVFWDGKVSGVDGLYYGASITNSDQAAVGGQGQNDMAYFVHGGYKTAFDKVNVDFGLNFGYKQSGNSNSAIPGVSSSVVAYNPYVNVNWEGLNLMGELLGASVQDGRVAAGPAGSRSTAAPMGFNIIPSYKITDEFELAFRYSHLQTNGRGVAPSAVVPGAANPVGGRSFNRADSFYFGGNWYIVGNDVKLSAGYEWTQFENPVNSPAVQGRYNVSAFRTRLQVLF